MKGSFGCLFLFHTSRKTASDAHHAAPPDVPALPQGWLQMTASLADIPLLLSECRTIAVVGLSIKPVRPSHGVAHYMQMHGYRIIPVNPMYAGTYILGELCYATLTQAHATLAEQGVKIDLVDCFRRSDAIEPLADEALAIGARCLCLQ